VKGLRRERATSIARRPEAMAPLIRLTTMVSVVGHDDAHDGADTVDVLRATRDFIDVEEDVRQACRSGRLPAGVRWMGRTLTQVRARLMALRPRTMESLVPMTAHNVFEEFREYDRRLIENGVERIDLYNPDGLWGDAAQVLASSPILPFARFAQVTVQLRIYDRTAVVIEGPRLQDDRTALVVSRPDVVAAARSLFEAALATSVPAPAAMADDPRPWLTPRQRDIVTLLKDDLHDDEVARELGVSVRTVRGDIEVVRALLGVRTRFATGFRLGQLEGSTAELPASYDPDVS
jgi:DNA-binding CsgD family transcriptional regulator